MKIRTRGTQAFNVPNNEEGRIFTRLMRKFINHRAGWGYRRRGRGARPKAQREDGTWKTTYVGQASLSPDADTCDWMAVYLNRRGPQEVYAPRRLRPVIDIPEYTHMIVTDRAGNVPPPQNDFELNNIMFRQSEGTGVVMEPAVSWLGAGGIFRIRVADWSNPILAGHDVALLNGEAISPVHDGQAPIIGVATGSQQWDDNLELATVSVRLENQLDANTVTLMDDDGIHVAADEILDEPDEVDLTPDEQQLLGDILKGVVEGHYFTEDTLGPGRLDIFHRLFNKLVD